MAKLDERARIGLTLGNDRNVVYPVGLDYYLARLLDALRHYAVRVRITFAADHYAPPAVGEVAEGHLRRYAGGDGQVWTYVSPPEDKLALHRNVGDRESHRIIGFTEGVDVMHDYDRLVRIECIDPLLLGDGDPVVFWEAPEATVAANAVKRRRSLNLARRHATLFLVHAAVVLIVIILLFMQVFGAYAAGDGWKLAGWCVGAFVLAMLAMGTLIPWEDVDLTVLRRRDPTADALTPPTML